MNTNLVVAQHERLLVQKQEETEVHIARLQKDQRQDEANLLKARRNVFGNFRSALLAHAKQGDGAIERYREILQKIHDSWCEAKDLAAKHNDVQRTAVEEIKLAAWKETIDLLDEKAGAYNA